MSLMSPYQMTEVIKLEELKDYARTKQTTCFSPKVGKTDCIEGSECKSQRGSCLAVM